MKHSLLVAFFIALAASSFGALEHDLGQGLAYARIADLNKDAAALDEALARDAVVIDLRNTRANPEEVARLAQRLDQAPPGPHGLRLILVNPTTDAALVSAVTQDHPRELTLGPKTPALVTDIPVSISVEDDRRAYEALNTGADLEKLISSNPEKRRFDEATLAHNHALPPATGPGTTDDDAEPELPTPAADSPAPAGAADAISTAAAPTPTPTPALPHDLVLARAIQLHRAIVAARK